MYSLVSLDKENDFIPGFVISLALNFIASSIGEKRDCSFLEINPEELVKTIDTPLIYMAGRSDQVCPLIKAREMYSDYRGMLD